MAREFVPRVTKVPNSGGFVQTSRLIDWVSRETDEQGQPVRVRVPEPEKHVYSNRLGFVAAGRFYPSALALTVLPVDIKNGVFRDMFGRKVLHIKERFPCFDSADLLYEHRFYRWAYLISGGRLTCVYWEDEGKKITVTEDVRKISGDAWKAMDKAGLIRDDILML